MNQNPFQSPTTEQPHISWTRTVQHEKYCPQKASIHFRLPVGMLLSDGYLLARAIVDSELGLIPDHAERASELCLIAFGQPLAYFAEQPKLQQPPEQPGTTARKQQLEEEYESNFHSDNDSDVFDMHSLDDFNPHY